MVGAKVHLINPKHLGISLPKVGYKHSPLLRVLGSTRPDCTYLALSRPMVPTRGRLFPPAVDSLRTITGQDDFLQPLSLSPRRVVLRGSTNKVATRVPQMLVGKNARGSLVWTSHSPFLHPSLRARVEMLPSRSAPCPGFPIGLF